MGCVYRAVKTEEGNAAARFFGLPEAITTVDESVDGLTAKVCRLVILFPVQTIFTDFFNSWMLPPVKRRLANFCASMRPHWPGKYWQFAAKDATHLGNSNETEESFF